MAKIKKIYKEKFTVLASSMFSDRNLNLKDRGLLATMMSLPDDWDFSIKGLAAILSDGERAIRCSLLRLEEEGYLIRRRLYHNGKVYDWEYIFSDHKLDVQNVNLDHLDERNVNVENEVVQNEAQLNKQELNKQELKVVNKRYNCLEDERFEKLDIPYLLRFQSLHEGDFIYYPIKDVAVEWIRNAQGYDTDEYIIEARRTLIETLSKEEKIISGDLASDLLKTGADYYHDLKYSPDKVKIGDLNRYYASIIKKQP